MVYQRKKRSQEQQQNPVPQVQASSLVSQSLVDVDTPNALSEDSSSAGPSLDMHRQQASHSGYDFGNIPIFDRTHTAQRQPQSSEAFTTGSFFSQIGSGVEAKHDKGIQPKLEAAVQRDEDKRMNLVPTGAGRAMPDDMQTAFTQAGMNHAAQAKYHVDDKAAKSINALAYTTRDKIVVQEKLQHNPAQLKKTLAHEGTHVEEQATMDIRPDVAGTPINASHEANAEANEERFAKGQQLVMDGATSSNQTLGLQRKHIPQSGFNFGDVAVDTVRRQGNSSDLRSVQAKQPSVSNSTGQIQPIQRVVDISQKSQGLAHLKKDLASKIQAARTAFNATASGCGMGEALGKLADAMKAGTLAQNDIDAFISTAKDIKKSKIKTRKVFNGETYQALSDRLKVHMSDKQKFEDQADSSDYRSSCYTPDDYAKNKDGCQDKYKITENIGVVSLHHTKPSEKYGGHSIVIFEYLEGDVPKTVRTDLTDDKHGALTSFQVRRLQGSPGDLQDLTKGGRRLWEGVPVANIKAGIAAAESMISEPTTGTRDKDNTIKYGTYKDTEAFRGKSNKYQYDNLGGRGIAWTKGRHNINCARYATKILKKTGITIDKTSLVAITPHNILKAKATEKYQE